MTQALDSALELLNEPQKKAVLHNQNPLLILAGAGSGKTRVITVKIAYLIEELGIDPRSILAVTFTNKAATEMRQRAEDLSEAACDVVIRTFHSFGAWLLRRNSANSDLNDNFTIYDNDDSMSLLHTLYPSLNRQDLRYWSSFISRAKDNCLNPSNDLSSISGEPKFPEVYATYETRLREIGNVDFGDLIMRPIELMEQHPVTGQRIKDRFQILLVDEYQDSNVAQNLLLSRIYQNGSYICVVGDDDQSIYRFRGAEVKNILEFPDQNENSDIIRLEQNYRSTNPVLQLAEAVVSNNRGRLGKHLWTDRDDTRLPVLAHLSDQEAELDYVITLLRDDFQGETAILYRTNAQSRSFETRFRRENIPYRIVGTARFYEREEIKDTIALLKLAANAKDEVAFNRIVNKPARGIGQVALNKISFHLQTARGNMLHAAEYAMSTANKKTAKGLAEFIELMKTADRLLNSGADQLEQLGEVIEHLVAESGIGHYHANQDEVTGSGKVQNLEELVNAASLYAPTMAGLVEFLEAIELDSGREQDDANAKVVLITMHNTKGLEFDRVVISGLENELFPRVDSNDKEALEEERRLFYVAITRARHELHLTTCSSRRIHGRTQSLNPSLFLSEIPGNLVEQYGGRTRDAAGVWPAPFDGEDPWESWGGDQSVHRKPEPKLEPEPDPDRPPMTYPAGQLIYHGDYGTGEVIKNNYNGSEEVIMVRFESGNTAQFIPRFSSIEKVSRD